MVLVLLVSHFSLLAFEVTLIIVSSNGKNSIIGKNLEMLW